MASMPSALGPPSAPPNLLKQPFLVILGCTRLIWVSQGGCIYCIWVKWVSPRQKGVLARARARGKGVGKESPGGLICSLAIGGGSVCGATTTIQEINRLSILIFLFWNTTPPLTHSKKVHSRVLRFFNLVILCY